MNWQESAADQNLRLAQKMLEQQGEINRLKKELTEARAQLATPCGDVREGLLGVTFTCERNLGHGGMHRDMESGAGWTYNDPSGSRD